jgi:biotin transport system ATP-binding protein
MTRFFDGKSDIAGRGTSLAPRPSERGIVFQQSRVARGGRQVLSIAELNICEARVGLIGDNGSGKSTLLRLINGLILPTSGRVLVAGLDTVLNRRELRAYAGFVFQNPDHQLIFPTVGEEIGFGLTERGLRPSQARERAIEVLKHHGYGVDWLDRNVNELSGGQKQLVCILAVLATEPSILLMDEPFSSLDLPTRLYLFRRIMALPQQIVMASHDFEVLGEFDRVIWLDEGDVRADGPPAEVIPAYRKHAMSAAAKDIVTPC